MNRSVFEFRCPVILLAASLFLVVCSLPAAGIAAAVDGGSSPAATTTSSTTAFLQRLRTPERTAAALSLSSSYDPNFNLSSVAGTVAALYDHGLLWDNSRSGNTVFKLEATAGSMVRPDIRLLTSLNLLAMYYPPLPVSGRYRPYLEAGIGVIYSDYRVDGQAYRLLFNPQLGIGSDLAAADGEKFFLAVRLHHSSNGSINRDNRGTNSLLLQVGKYF